MESAPFIDNLPPPTPPCGIDTVPIPNLSAKCPAPNEPVIVDEPLIAVLVKVATVPPPLFIIVSPSASITVAYPLPLLFLNTIVL